MAEQREVFFFFFFFWERAIGEGLKNITASFATSRSFGLIPLVTAEDYSLLRVGEREEGQERLASPPGLSNIFSGRVRMEAPGPGPGAPPHDPATAGSGPCEAACCKPGGLSFVPTSLRAMREHAVAQQQRAAGAGPSAPASAPAAGPSPPKEDPTLRNGAPPHQNVALYVSGPHSLRHERTHGDKLDDRGAYRADLRQE